MNTDIKKSTQNTLGAIMNTDIKKLTQNTLGATMLNSNNSSRSNYSTTIEPLQIYLCLDRIRAQMQGRAL